MKAPLTGVKPETPMNDWTSLLACPFCSGPAKLLSAPDRALLPPRDGGSSCVICERCGAGGPLFEVADHYCTQDALDRRAARAWNKRGNLAGAERKLRRIAMILNQDG